MSKLTEYTLEIYKTDKRTKTGTLLVDVKDFEAVTEAYIDTVVNDYASNGYIVKKFQTYVTKTNLIGGKTFTERYDTPSFCSPSSESYWSM